MVDAIIGIAAPSVSKPPFSADRRQEAGKMPAAMEHLRCRCVVHGPTAAGAERMTIIWTIIIGFIAGVIAKFVTPGDNQPSGFILTTLLGIAGAFVATWLGQAIGWYQADEGAGLIGATVGAIIVLLIWGYFQTSRERSRRRT